MLLRKKIRVLGPQCTLHQCRLFVVCALLCPRYNICFIFVQGTAESRSTGAWEAAQGTGEGARKGRTRTAGTREVRAGEARKAGEGENGKRKARKNRAGTPGPRKTTSSTSRSPTLWGVPTFGSAKGKCACMEVSIQKQGAVIEFIHSSVDCWTDHIVFFISFYLFFCLCTQISGFQLYCFLGFWFF